MRSSSNRAANRRSRTSPPCDLMDEQIASEPGTRSMSPKEQKITSGRRAMACALSIISSGVTQTGQPGPCTSSMPSGSRTIDSVLHDGVGLAAADLHNDPRPGLHAANLVDYYFARAARSRYSSRYFIAAYLQSRASSTSGASSSVSWSICFQQLGRCDGLLLHQPH